MPDIIHGTDGAEPPTEDLPSVGVDLDAGDENDLADMEDACSCCWTTQSMYDEVELYDSRAKREPEHTRPTAKWGEEDEMDWDPHAAETAAETAATSASHELVQLYNDIAVLTHLCNDQVRRGLEHVRWIHRSCHRSRRLRPHGERYCVRVMQFWKRVALQEVANGQRSPPGTAISILLNCVEKFVLHFRGDVERIWYMSVVNRSARRVMIRRLLAQHLKNLKQNLKSIESHLQLLNSNQRMALGPSLDSRLPLLSSGPLQTDFLQTMSSAFSTLARLLSPSDSKTDVQKLLALYPFLHNIVAVPIFPTQSSTTQGSTSQSGVSLDAPVASDPIAPANAITTATPSVSVVFLSALGIAQGAPDEETSLMAALEVALKVHSKTLDTGLLRFADASASVGWKRSVSEAVFRLVRTLKLTLPSPTCFIGLHGLLIGFTQIGLYAEACVAAELLIAIYRESLHHEPSVKIQLSLCNALGALSYLSLQVSFQPVVLNSIFAAKDALQILQPIYERDPDQHIALKAKLEAQQVRASSNLRHSSSSSENYDCAVELCQRAVALDPSNLENKHWLGVLLQYGSRRGHPEHGKQRLDIIRELSAAEPRLYDRTLALEIQNYAEGSDVELDDSIAALEEVILMYEGFPDVRSVQDTEKLAKLCQDLARCYQKQHQSDKYIGLLRKTVQLRTSLPTPTRNFSLGSESLPHSILELSKAYSKLEQYGEALALAERAEALYRAHYDESLHGCQEQITSVYLVAVGKHMLGRYAEAEAQVQEVMRGQTAAWKHDSICGPADMNHIWEYVEAMGTLGAIQCALGDTDSALHSGSEAARWSKRNLRQNRARIERRRRITGNDIASDLGNAHTTDYVLEVSMHRMLVFYAATLLDVGRAEEARAVVEESVEGLGRLEGVGPLYKTALLLCVKVLDAVGGREDEAKAVKDQASNVPFRGFLQVLGRKTV
ncbi:unnamed protein product [Tilletia controversa]|uniref:Uncharacterized protein n=1 Tax=Tilletia controversa TaxID=13291 RepID=A0A8X7MRV2_9BASI|nr:hypothetical protein CF328_g4466 [Tilletia controversa]KAE8246568.1 hypothetical protein A4X06_0g4964 [Tilletia controversa]CAD6933392.1 unnamed protein product [Tilletia controversa]CAD6941953.1 unnamed protein product [Tilletia controversa]CAD6947709.1 unnamed protein product [Tilletia controversa]